MTKFLSAHHGVVDRTELTRLHVTKHQLGRWVAEGRLERVAPRVWRVNGSADTWHQRLMTGILSLGEDGAASHNAAAQLHQFDRTPKDVVEFLVPREHRCSRLQYTVHHSKLIRPWDFVTVDGLRTTSATRTILDLANTRARPDRISAAIDTAVRLQLSAPEAIARRVYDIRRRGRTGVRLLDRLLLDAGGHTMLEREFLRLMREGGLPRPTPQVVFRDGARTIARVDFLYEPWDRADSAIHPRPNAPAMPSAATNSKTSASSSTSSRGKTSPVVLRGCKHRCSNACGRRDGPAAARQPQPRSGHQTAATDRSFDDQNGVGGGRMGG